MEEQGRVTQQGVSFTLSFIILACVLLSISSSTVTRSASVEKSCRSHPQLVGSCFNVHGRLSVYNGAPALRIWKTGTKRMFGVSGQRFAVPGYTNIPEEVRSKVDQDNDVYADFVLCPFTRQKENEMQIVCIEQARNVVVKSRKP